MEFEILDQKETETLGQLVAGVRKYNAEYLGEEESKPLSVIARDDNGILIGGVSGRTIYQHFLIEVVWVDKQTRGTGLGRKLMGLAEKEAKDRACVGSQVDTLSFQGSVFYEKLGFEVIGKIPNYPANFDRYFLLKKY